MRSFQLFGASLFLIGMAAATIAAESPAIIHVSPQGDDAHEGSAELPVATIAAAQQLVRKMVAAGDASAVRVEIAPGEYALVEPLKFTPLDSDLNCPVTYAAAGDGVVISGGMRVTEWRQVEKHWEATVPPLEINDDDSSPPSAAQPSIRDLWVNGRRAARARAPNEGFYRVEQAGPDNRTSFVVAPADLLPLAHPEQAEVGFLHDWSMSRIRLAAIDAAARTYRFDDPIGGNMAQFAISNFEPNPRYFVENAPELLDAPGEWYFDETTRTLRYVPQEGEMIDQTAAVVPLHEQLLVVQGEVDEPVTALAFEGLIFSHTRFDLPPHGYAGIQSSWYERRASSDDSAGMTMTSAVLVDGAESCRFSRCRFERLAACGLHLARTEGVEVHRCEFRDIGGEGVMIGSRDPLEMPVNENTHVTDCTIEDCGVTFHGAVGLWIGFARGALVQNNELRNLPYTGVSVGWQWDDQPTPCQCHGIYRNHIHHVMQLLSDGGGIYTLGLQPGTNLTENVIHDVPLNAGRAESNGIFMDEGSTSMTVSGNLIYNIDRSPIRFHRAGENSVVNNRLISRPGIPPFSFLSSEPMEKVIGKNEEVVADDWTTPAADPTVAEAGPRPTE